MIEDGLPRIHPVLIIRNPFVLVKTDRHKISYEIGTYVSSFDKDYFVVDIKKKDLEKITNIVNYLNNKIFGNPQKIERIIRKLADLKLKFDNWKRK